MTKKRKKRSSEILGNENFFWQEIFKCLEVWNVSILCRCKLSLKYALPRVADDWNSRYRLCGRLWHRLLKADYDRPAFWPKIRKKYYFSQKSSDDLFLTMGTDYAYSRCIGTALDQNIDQTFSSHSLVLGQPLHQRWKTIYKAVNYQYFVNSNHKSFCS